MIELGLIRLQHRSSIFEARNKIRGLADALGYDPIDATRLATAVSEATRELLRNSREPRIAVAWPWRSHRRSSSSTSKAVVRYRTSLGWRVFSMVSDR